MKRRKQGWWGILLSMAMIFSIIVPSAARADAVKPAVTGSDSLYGSRINVREPQAMKTLSGVAVNGVSYSSAADENEVKNGAQKYFVKSNDGYIYISKLAKGDTVVLKAEPKSISFQVNRPNDYFEIIDKSTLQWIEKVKSHKVVFKSLIEGQPDFEAEIEDGERVVPPIEKPVRAGYTFDGWNTDENGTGMPWTPDFIVSKEITFFAVWRPVVQKVTVTFDRNDGTGAMESREIVKGEKISDLPELSREGYIFRGWFMEKKEPGEVLTTSPITADKTFDKDATVYAYWKKAYVLMGDDVITKGEEAKYTIDLPVTDDIQITMNGQPIPDEMWLKKSGAEPNTTVIVLKPEYIATLDIAEKAYELFVTGTEGWGSLAEISVRESEPQPPVTPEPQPPVTPEPQPPVTPEPQPPVTPEPQPPVTPEPQPPVAPEPQPPVTPEPQPPVAPEPQPPVAPEPQPPVKPSPDPKPQAPIKSDAAKPVKPSVDKTVTVTKTVAPSKNVAPKTGDNMSLFAVVGALSIALIGIVAVEGRKKQSK